MVPWLVLPPLVAVGLCPGVGEMPGWHPGATTKSPPSPGYLAALGAIDFGAVRSDLRLLFNTSEEWWPSDYGNYGPLFVRLAWHCSGSYRLSDGRGGCDGGRQRFDPEQSWPDNTNLDKARRLLWPIKKKYGIGLSWGDLFILAGTEAVEAMGGPTLGFCGGRIDDADGSASLPLGPSVEQDKDWPCKVNGECPSPLGSTTVGLIYLNPEGPMGEPHPEVSATQIRDTFGRMSMNDTETVALIGGGHAFGKTHGACPAGAGPSPAEDPANPWPGMCGTGKGADAFTAGFEGPWTATPTSWDNTYFINLISHDWVKHKGPGGHWQWKVNGSDAPVAPGPQGGTQEVMMLTSDVSLLTDPSYKQIVTAFAKDQKAFERAWVHAWYKLTTRDMGPVTRCVGDHVPPPQPWQFPLPPAPSALPDYAAVADAVRQLVTPQRAHRGGLLVNLAWRCAATFRSTDYRGGCNGARIRFAPEAGWEANAGWSTDALNLLAPIQRQFATAGLSWADLIVLAGSVAIEVGGGPTLLTNGFCGGRTDASNGAGSQHLEPKLNENLDTDKTDTLHETYTLMGLTPHEYVALVGGVRSLGKLSRRGFDGNATSKPDTFDNEFFVNLADMQWEKTVSGTGKIEYKARGKELYVLPSDVLLRYDPALMAIVQEYAIDNQSFASSFAAAWHKVMTADLFDGPAKRRC